jgi:hypothetical protein
MKTQAPGPFRRCGAWLGSVKLRHGVPSTCHCAISVGPCPTDRLALRLQLFADAGGVAVIKKAVCMKEEDSGMAWLHTEYRTNHREVRLPPALALPSPAATSLPLLLP